MGCTNSAQRVQPLQLTSTFETSRLPLHKQQIAETSKYPIGELFIDIIPLVAAVGYAHEVRQCRYLCGTTFRVVQKGATADMLIRSIERQLKSLAHNRKMERMIFEGHEKTTTLIRAAMKSDSMLCNKLLCEGCNIDLQSQYNYTALHFAANKGDIDVVKILCFWNANLTLTTSQGFTPLHFACRYGNADVVNLLLKNGASHTLNSQTRDGETPLHIAASKGRISVVALLLSNKAILEIQDINKETPLLRGVMSPACIDLLIDAGANLNARDKMGRTVLLKAVTLIQIETVKKLIEKGADIEAVDFDSRSPLHLAAVTGNVNLLDVLLAAGASITIRDKKNKTPLSICIDRGHDLAAKKLKEFEQEQEKQKEEETIVEVDKNENAREETINEKNIE
jgi:ankyrin repeat protein